jgi:hypothetical protein
VFGHEPFDIKRRRVVVRDAEFKACHAFVYVARTRLAANGSTSNGTHALSTLCVSVPHRHIIFPSQLPQPPGNGQAQQPEGFQAFHTPIEPVMGLGAPPSGFSSVPNDNAQSTQDPQPPRGLDQTLDGLC